MIQRRRTILFVHPSDELYGSDRCLLELTRGLPETDRAIVALPTDVRYGGHLTAELTTSGVRVERLEMLVLRRNLLRPSGLPTLAKRFIVGTWNLTRLIRDENVTLVHSNTIAVMSGAFAATLTRTPHVWHIHEYVGDEPAPYRTTLRAALTAIPGTIVANSKAVARSIAGRRTFVRRKLRVIYNGVPVATASEHPIHIRPDDTPIIGVIGRLSPRKGIPEAIHAAALLKGEGRDFRMRFIGAPPPGQERLLDEYRRLAAEAELDDVVEFSGETPDIGQEYRTLDIVLVPSQRPESFGMVIVEAMEAGVSVVATRTGGGSDELMEDGVSGLYCGKAPADIAGALGRLIDGPDLRRSLAERGRIDVRRRFSLKRYQASFNALYDRLAGPAS